MQIQNSPKNVNSRPSPEKKTITLATRAYREALRYIFQ